MLTRDQKRAKHAYACVKRLSTGQRDNYKVLVNGLGANILRSGLAATIAFLERENREEAKLLLKDLDDAEIPGLEPKGNLSFPDRVRELDLDKYMLATREMLRVVLWFRRAVQADPKAPEPKEKAR